MLLVCSRVGGLSVRLYRGRMDKIVFVYEKVLTSLGGEKKGLIGLIVFRWTTDIL